MGQRLRIGKRIFPYGSPGNGRNVWVFPGNPKIIYLRIVSFNNHENASSTAQRPEGQREALNHPSLSAILEFSKNFMNLILPLDSARLGNRLLIFSVIGVWIIGCKQQWHSQPAVSRQNLWYIKTDWQSSTVEEFMARGGGGPTKDWA